MIYLILIIVVLGGLALYFLFLAFLLWHVASQLIEMGYYDKEAK